eukprot:TRINITY_DN34989_c0_g1_i1.p1 TRINITY_DN34989_c0_g1~~TRINITY_DN34989_c0_g1_i1.p1  ORF type:complete len:570 (+),score=124.42 TRINITY_DN34989_c0_g1_i1:120-1829(+)
MLRAPVLTRAEELAATENWVAGSAGVAGWRPEMEDVQLLVALPSGAVACAVFDGHCGDGCSGFASRRMRELLLSEGPPRTPRAAEELCLRIDAEYIAAGSADGSTVALAVVLPDGGMLVAHAGDSRAVLAGLADGALMPAQGSGGALTRDHTPAAPAERARVEAAGGCVKPGRVPRVITAAAQRGIAVTRALGDRDFKLAPGRSPREQAVTACPDVIVREFPPGGLLLLASDGAFEGRLSCAAAAEVAAQTIRNGGSPDAAAAAVCLAAVQGGSKDNVSCCVICAASAVSIPGPAYRRCVVPGPLSRPRDCGFAEAWRRMAERVGAEPAQLLAERLAALQAAQAGTLTAADVQELRVLQSAAAAGPVDEDGGSGTAALGRLLDALCRPPAPGTGRARMRLAAAGERELRAACAEQALSWEDEMLHCCGRTGVFTHADCAAGAVKVDFGDGASVWLPQGGATPAARQPRLVRVARRGEALHEALSRLEGAAERLPAVWGTVRHVGGRVGLVLSPDSAEGGAQLVLFESLRLQVSIPDEALLWGPVAPRAALAGTVPPSKRLRLASKNAGD